MKTQIKITATAPTAYQLNSLRRFHLGCKPRFGGSYYGEEEFYSIEEAQDYLIYIAEEYFENSIQLNEAIEDIKRGALTIDGVTARIEEFEIESQN